MKKTAGKVLLLSIIAAVAFILKLHYSRAAADQLQWILSPTAACVGLLGGRSFTYEAGTGYCDFAHLTVIAPVCAGVNFMVVVFCMVAVMVVLQVDRRTDYLILLPASLLSAWGVTIAVNAVRIGVGTYCGDAGLHLGWMTPERVHRLVGIIVYFFALCGIYAASDRFLEWLTARECRGRRHAVLPGIAIFSPVLIPALWYIAVTLLVPFLSGRYSFSDGHRIEHTLWVLAVPASVLVFSLLLRHRGTVLGRIMKMKRRVV